MSQREFSVLRAEEPEEQSRCSTDDSVSDETPAEGYRSQKRGSAQHEEKVEEIAADDVSYGNISISLQSGFCADGEFRQTGPQSDNGKPDDSVADAGILCNGGSAVNGHIAAQNHSDDPDGDTEKRSARTEYRVSLRHSAVCPSPFYQNQQIDKKGDENRPENCSDEKVQFSQKCPGACDEHRDTDDERYLRPYGVSAHCERRNAGGDSQNQQDIQNIASHHISHGNFRISLKRCTDADGGFGKRRSESSGGKSHHDHRDMEPQSHTGGPVDKIVGPLHQKDKTHC